MKFMKRILVLHKQDEMSLNVRMSLKMKHTVKHVCIFFSTNYVFSSILLGVEEFSFNDQLISFLHI